MQKNNVFHKFYFCLTFFLIASYQILQNGAILINHKSFFQENNFPKHNSYKKIAEFISEIFILENWKRLSCKESFS